MVTFLMLHRITSSHQAILRDLKLKSYRSVNRQNDSFFRLLEVYVAVGGDDGDLVLRGIPHRPNLVLIII